MVSESSILAIVDGGSIMKQWLADFRNDLRNTFEDFISKWNARVDKKFGEKNVAQSVKELTKPVGETKVVVEVEPQDSKDAETEADTVEMKVLAKEPIGLEGDAKLVLGLRSDKSNLVEQQAIIKHNNEVTSRINVVNTCERIEEIYLLFADNVINVNDPYVFRLLLIGSCMDEINFDNYCLRTCGNVSMARMKVADHIFTASLVGSHCSGLVLRKKLHYNSPGNAKEKGIVIENSLAIHGKHGIVCDALLVFDIMINKDIVAWSFVLPLCAKNGIDNIFALTWEILNHFFTTKCSVDAPIIAKGVLIDICSKCGKGKNVEFMFQFVPIKNLITWNDALLDLLVSKFNNTEIIDLPMDKITLQSFQDVAREEKIEFSSISQTEINLPSITAVAFGVKHLKVMVIISKFEILVNHLIKRIKVPYKNFLKDLGKSLSVEK
ncbi:hypothetical protein DITRI_Ditri02bG0090300 [Diplodiscus trichospermus]